MQAQVENGDAASNDSPLRLESMARFTKIPIVESALGVATGVYEKVKESNSVVGWTMNQAEVASEVALKTVETKLGKPLHAVDTILCKGIDIVEEMVPAVKLPPQKILAATREYVTAGLKDPNRGAAARVIVAGVGVATAGLRTAVSAVEWYMDKYLPEQKNEGNGEKDSIQGPEGEKIATEDPRDVIIRLQKVSRRIQRNLIRIASVQIKCLKQQREDAVIYVGGMAQYIKAAVVHPKEMVSKAGVAWTDMVKRLQEESDKKPMVHRLTCGVVTVLDNARQSLHSIPDDVTSRLNAASKYGASIIGSFLNGILKSRGETEGSNSDEKAKQLCQRQEKGTSPPPQQLAPVIKPVILTNDRGSSTSEDREQKSSPELSERVIKANIMAIKS